jgi:hypothetical protein
MVLKARIGFVIAVLHVEAVIEPCLAVLLASHFELINQTQN